MIINNIGQSHNSPVKKELSPEDFLTRAERIKQMNIRESNDQVVIVKANNEALGFRFNCYNEAILKDKVDKPTFDNTVKYANKICEDAWRRKKNEEDSEYSRSLKYVLYFAILISSISFLLLILLIYGPGGDGLLYASIALISIAGVLTIGVVIKSMFSLPKFMVLEETIINQLRDLLENENTNTYRRLNLNWTMQEKFYWLELNIVDNPNKTRDLNNNNL